MAALRKLDKLDTVPYRTSGFFGQLSGRAVRLSGSGQVAQLVGVADRVDRDDRFAVRFDRERLDAFVGAEHEAGEAVDRGALDLIGARQRALGRDSDDEAQDAIAAV